MEKVSQVLHMNGEISNTSYANNSLLQKNVISLTKGVRDEAIRNLFGNGNTFLKALRIADLGCSSGPNTLFVMSEVIKIVEKRCQEQNHESPEYQIFLNDLPGNDFNNIFKSIDIFKEKLDGEVEGGMGPCFIYGVPGSFYGRLFPSETLHFIHSSYSLQWLSQVPKGVDNNKGNIYMARTSPTNVLKAYYEQFQRDFSFFLKCRAQELVQSGRMVLTFLGRKSENKYSKECCYIWQLLAIALNDMVLEGIIMEEQMDTFNIPQYTPSPSEVKLEVLKEGSFTIDRLEVTEANWDAYDECHGIDGAYNVTKCMRAVAEPLLACHFGEEIIQEVFERYLEILVDKMSKEKTKFINVSISMTKKA